MCLTLAASFLSECWWLVTAQRWLTDPERVTAMSIYQISVPLLLHGRRKGSVETKLQNCANFCLQAQIFFLFPCGHQKLHKLDNLPGHCSSCLGKNSSYKMPCDSKRFVVIYMRFCSLATEDLACVVQLIVFSSFSLLWLLKPGAQTTLHWELLEQWYVTSYSI